MDSTLIRTPYGHVRLGAFREVVAPAGRYLNDHCLVWGHEAWHLFSIVGRSAAAPADSGAQLNESTLLHATTPDLETWTIHEDVLPATTTWPEGGVLFAPNVHEHNGVFYMLYTTCDERAIQRICLATSRDLFAWERYAGNPVIVPSISWSAWPDFALKEPDGERSFGGCRDAHILRLDDGRFVAYWVSRLRQDRSGEGMCCVAASISHDLVHWQEVGPVFAHHEFHRPLTREVESPCVVRKDGRYWLFFKNGWWTWFVSSEDPFDFEGNEAERLGYAHAAEVFHWRDQWWITHCKTDPDDYACERSDCSRGLFLGPLDWPAGGRPALV